MLCFDFDTMCKINAFPSRHYYFYCVKFRENQGQSKISDVKRRVVIGNMVAPGIQRVTSLRPMRCDVVCGAWCMSVSAWTMDSNRKDRTWTLYHLEICLSDLWTSAKYMKFLRSSNRQLLRHVHSYFSVSKI